MVVFPVLSAKNLFLRCADLLINSDGGEAGKGKLCALGAGIGPSDIQYNLGRPCTMFDSSFQRSSLIAVGMSSQHYFTAEPLNQG